MAAYDIVIRNGQVADGTGKKLFRDGATAAALRLVSASTTSTGVIIATYQPAGPVQTGSYALDQ